jgi:hypothetical protein
LNKIQIQTLILKKGNKMKKIAMIIVMLSALSTSAEALEYECEIDQWSITHCGWIIVKF